MHSSDFVNHSYDKRQHWTPLGPITIINQKAFHGAAFRKNTGHIPNVQNIGQMTRTEKIFPNFYLYNT